jgi:hypothetical protein
MAINKINRVNKVNKKERNCHWGDTALKKQVPTLSVAPTSSPNTNWVQRKTKKSR